MSHVVQEQARATLPAHWRQPLAALGVLLLGLGFLFRDTLTAMVLIWERSETFAHAFVVPPIALWLIWRRRHELALMQPGPNFLFLLPMAVMGLGWLLGELVSTNSVTQLMAVAMIVLAVPAVLGARVAAHIAFPLGFLFFCVPIGEFLMPLLMERTADFTVMALRLSGIPVYREGLQFVIPSGNWSVVEACSGVRYLIASLMVGTLFAYLNYHSMRRRWVFVGVAIVLPVVANWLRAYGIVMLGHYSGNKLAVGVDHLIYGWVFFGIVMLAMFMIGARWSQPELAFKAGVADQPLAGADKRLWPLVLAGLLVLGLPHLALNRLDHYEGSRELTLPAPALAAWERQEQPLSSWAPVFENPAAQQQWAYAKDGRAVGLHLAYYRHQGYDSKLINSQNVAVRSHDKQWARTGDTLATVDLDAAGSVNVRGTEIRGVEGASAPRLLAWQFFWVNGHLTSSDMRVKLYTAAARLQGQGDDSAAVTVYTLNPAENSELAPQMLRQFLRENWAAIEQQLQASRRSQN